MKKLIEMSELVTDFVDTKQLKHLFSGDSYDPKAFKLLDGILQKRYNTDEEASFDLYESSPENKGYQMLKSRTRERMVNLVFTLDNNKRMKVPYQKALFTCSRNIIVARLLSLKGLINVAVDYLRTALSIAQKYQFTDLEVLSARLLRNHQAFTSTQKEFDKYNAIINQANDKLIAEIEMEECKERIILLLKNTSAPKEKLRKIAVDCFKKAKVLFKQNKSHSLILNYYRIAVFHEHIFENHAGVVKACNECIDYVTNNRVFTDKFLLAEMSLQKVDTSLYLRDYELGKESAKVCMEIFNPGYLNWLIFLECYFLLCLHTKNYKEAQKIFNDVLTHPKFKYYPADHLEKWKIFEAYLSYILPVRAKQKSFNVFKFTNEVPIFSKDKRGYNLSIIIGQIVLLIKMGDFDKVMDKFHSLKSYAHRYINKKKNPRSFYFVKMILLMVKYEFDYEKTKTIGNKFFVKMNQSKLGNQGELETLEVIPYDILWEDLLEKLKPLTLDVEKEK